MKPDIKFSFVIPTYNRAELLTATLESVFRQTCNNFEVIIVDDGSTDDSIQVARSFGDSVKVFQRDHAGCAAARNYGVRQASGDYLFFLDSDDLLFPWSLKVYSDSIKEFDFPSIVAGELLRFDDPGELNSQTKSEVVCRSYEHYFEGSLDTKFFLGTGVCAISREEFLKSGGFIERDIAGTDSDLLFRMGTSPGFVKIDSPIVLGYRMHDQNILKNLDKLFGGANFLIDSEKQGKYPGGNPLRRHRETHIGIRTRAISLKLVQNHLPKQALQIYWSTLGLNLRHLKWRYLLAIPTMAAIPPLRSLN